MATIVFLNGELLGPGAESTVLPLPSLLSFTGYDGVQNRLSGQVGVDFETLEVMGHNCAGLPLSLSDRLQTLTLTLYRKMNCKFTLKKVGTCGLKFTVLLKHSLNVSLCTMGY